MLKTQVRTTFLAPATAGALALILALASPASVRSDDTGLLNVELRYAPQESVGSDNPALAPGISDRAIRVEIAEGRTLNDLAVIGETTDDDDRLWPVRATNDVIAFALDVLARNTGPWGIRTAEDAPLIFSGKLTRLQIKESNKAVGSTYNAEVQFAFSLRSANGALLWEGSATGDATRYGRARSVDNINEVLSDALKEAYAQGLAETALQDAWLGKKSPGASAVATTTPTASAMTPEALLAELVKLKKKGFDADVMLDFVGQKNLSRSLSADDLVAWKDAGIPEQVIKAALARAGN